MDTILIKRYKNRKFWAKGFEKDRKLLSTSMRKYRQPYISLKEIEALLREGKQIKVIHQVSGKDITKEVLKTIALKNYRTRLNNVENLMLLRYEALRSE